MLDNSCITVERYCQVGYVEALEHTQHNLTLDSIARVVGFVGVFGLNLKIEDLRVSFGQRVREARQKQFIHDILYFHITAEVVPKTYIPLLCAGLVRPFRMFSYRKTGG